MGFRLSAVRCYAAAPSRCRAAFAWRPEATSGRRRTHTTQLAAAAAESDVVSEEAAQLLRQSKPKTVATRRLSSKEAIDALYASQHAVQRDSFAAFYSSELGGIVTDPALMVVQFDDHMVHRGHAVFDTAILKESYLYQLDQHLERFLNSARKANIPLPMSVEQMRRTILETTAASCKVNGFVRYMLSAGRGGFGLSGNECLRPSLYVMVYTHDKSDGEEGAYLKGWKVKTSPVPIKSSYFTKVKSNNYLPNALNLMDAQAEGFDQGIFVDGDGYVSEGPNMNIAVLLKDGTLVVPPFDNSLNGITIQRVMELLPAAIAEGLEGIARVEQRHISVDEAKRSAAEVFLAGSSLPVMPVVQWDDTIIGDGTPGITTLCIRAMMTGDMVPREGSDQHVEVPYGWLTGMGM
ncbi:hypothetical protein N2152v2_003140 [Parachlorella kessleri]